MREGEAPSVREAAASRDSREWLLGFVSPSTHLLSAPSPAAGRRRRLRGPGKIASRRKTEDATFRRPNERQEEEEGTFNRRDEGERSQGNGITLTPDVRVRDRQSVAERGLQRPFPLPLVVASRSGDGGRDGRAGKADPDLEITSSSFLFLCIDCLSV